MNFIAIMQSEGNKLALLQRLIKLSHNLCKVGLESLRDVAYAEERWFVALDWWVVEVRGLSLSFER